MSIAVNLDWHGRIAASALDGLLIGRDDEISLLTDCVQQVKAGQGRAVLIEGEPGIGKSTLARAACADAGQLGCQVFWGAGDELGQTLPLSPFLDGLRTREPILSPRRDTILTLLRGERAAGRGEDLTAALAEQLLALVDELCAAQPMVLVIDDLQWADQASVGLWERLARSAQHRPLLLIGIMRPVPQREDLLALRHTAALAARLQLGGLAEAQVTDLVAALAGGKPAGELLRLADGAAGNPLYLTELMDALTRSASLSITDAGVAEVTGDSAPDSLTEAIADRLRFVPSRIRQVLRAAALLGVDFHVSDLATVLGCGVADLIPAVDEACAAGVLAESGHGLGFRHQLIRTALYEEMPAPVRAAWHREAAHALAQAGAAADRVARQLLAAVAGAADTEPVDEWILRWLAQTAPLLVGQAPRAAAELLRHAVTRAPARSARHDALVCRYAEALYRVGDAADAERVASRALADIVEPDHRIDLHWTLAQCRTLSGRFTESLTALDEVLAHPELSGWHRARLLVLTARAHRQLGEVEKAGQVAAAALEEATAASDDWAIGWALHVLTMVTVMQGRMTDAPPLFDRALAVTQADPALTDLRLLLQINQAVTLGDLDQYEGAVVAARRAQSLAGRAGLAVRRTQAHSCLGELLFHTGHWDEALHEVGVVEECTKDPGVACCDHGVAAVMLFHRGDTSAAQQHLATATPHAKRIGNRVVGTLALARSLDREQAGDLAQALAVLTGFADSAEELDEIEDLLPDGVRLAARCGDGSAARALTDRAESLARDTSIPHRQANALFCRGLLDRDPGRLLRAADRYGDAGRPLLGAQALEDAAGIFLDLGQREAARKAFTRSLDLYTALGAARDVARLQARFRAHGIRRAPRVKHRKARRGWDSLTPTEVRITELVAQGLSNPQIAEKLFLSRRTVGTHVSHILSKLDVKSRIDIAREAGSRQAAS
ncbi:MAG TPA: AAA family ATPase [Streptosporangiaceae bacterium]|nr:AAA family ATPase [Streptosporangiaceae bacterium]